MNNIFTFVVSLLKLQILNYIDYYQILGVPKDSRRDEIKAAYKALAAKFHPDKNKTNKFAHERFSLINEAFEVLHDPNLRKTYDAEIATDQKIENAQTTEIIVEAITIAPQEITPKPLAKSTAQVQLHGMFGLPPARQMAYFAGALIVGFLAFTTIRFYITPSKGPSTNTDRTKSSFVLQASTFGSVAKTELTFNEIIDKANLAFADSNFSVAAQLYDQAVQLDSSNFISQYRNGYCNFKLDNLEKALVSFNDAGYIEPTDYNSFYYKANCLIKMGKYTGAVKALTQALQINPRKADLYYLRAKANMKINRVNDACDDYNEAYNGGIKSAEKYVNICDKPSNNTQEERHYTPQTGDAPYNYFYGCETDNNANQNDALILLIDKNSGKVVRNAYIRAQDQFDFKHLPKGKYFIKITYGKDWAQGKAIANKKFKEGFSTLLQEISYNTSDRVYTISDEVVNNVIKNAYYFKTVR